MTDASNSGSKPSTAPQGSSKLTAYATNSGPFIVQSNQIAMHSVERMMNLQADVLKASFNDMQGLVEKQGNPSPEAASEAFKLIVDRSMEHVRTDLSPKFPPALSGVLGVKSLALGRHLVHCLSLQKFHRCQVA